jgi:hypothetical protein
MPFAGFDDWDDCIQTMTDEEGHDKDSAENICGALQAEHKSESGDAEALFDALERGSGLIADVGVDLVSGVDVPAVDSKWVLTKSGGARKGHDFRANSPILLSKADGDTDGDSKRISYAAAMIPREPDKEGDVAPTPTVEKAAHDFLKSDGGIDTDHSLIDGEGQPVESWVLKQARSFDLPDGGEETYPAGTWMLGIEWGADAWKRIQNGELTGLSIYGMAEHVPLARAVSTCVECGGSLATAGETGDTPKGESAKSAGMADAQTGDGQGGDGSADTGDGDGTGDGPDIEAVAASVDDLSETVADVTETLATVKEAVETEKQDAREAAQILAEEMGFEDAEAVLDALSDADDMDDEVENENDDEMDEEEDKSAETETAEKRADDANLAKGGDGAATAQSGVTDDGAASSGLPSYAAAAEAHEEGN